MRAVCLMRMWCNGSTLRSGRRGAVQIRHFQYFACRFKAVRCTFGALAYHALNTVRIRKNQGSWIRRRNKKWQRLWVSVSWIPMKQIETAFLIGRAVFLREAMRLMNICQTFHRRGPSDCKLTMVKIVCKIIIDWLHMTRRMTDFSQRDRFRNQLCTRIRGKNHEKRQQQGK